MTVKISAALVVANLKDAVKDVDEHQAALEAARRERNELIREALVYIPMLRMVKITGLSREQLYRIKVAAGQSES